MKGSERTVKGSDISHPQRLYDIVGRSEKERRRAVTGEARRWTCSRRTCRSAWPPGCRFAGSPTAPPARPETDPPRCEHAAVGCFCMSWRSDCECRSYGGAAAAGWGHRRHQALLQQGPGDQRRSSLPPAALLAARRRPPAARRRGAARRGAVRRARDQLRQFRRSERVAQCRAIEIGYSTRPEHRALPGPTTADRSPPGLPRIGRQPECPPRREMQCLREGRQRLITRKPAFPCGAAVFGRGRASRRTTAPMMAATWDAAAASDNDQVGSGTGWRWPDRKQRHQSLAESQRKRKERQCKRKERQWKRKERQCRITRRASTTSKGIRLWQAGRGSAIKGSGSAGKSGGASLTVPACSRFP